MIFALLTQGTLFLEKHSMIDGDMQTKSILILINFNFNDRPRHKELSC